MSGSGIELQISGQTPGIVPHSAPVIETGVQLPELPVLTGEENGAIFFNLEWQTRHAGDLRQNLFTFFGHPNESNETENRARRDLISVAREHEDFKEFRRQPENFWQRVRQLSEPRILRDANGDETRTVSRFDEMLATMKAKNISPREFAETLPLREREVFKARLQLEKTFGTQIFSDGDAAPDEAQQNRSREIPAGTQSAAEPGEGENTPKSTSPAIAPDAPQKTTTFGTKSAPLPDENAAVLQNPKSASPKSAASELNFVPVRENQISDAPQNFKTDSFGNPTLQNAAPTAFSPTAPNNQPDAPTALPETFVARVLTDAAAENPPNNNAATQRNDGTMIGGALINGAFAAIENYQNLRDDRIGDGRAGANSFDENGNGSAAGATGALFGAAVGTFVSSAETAVGGVLGFVSSVVVGVEADRGLRWLGAGGTTFGAEANDQKSLTNSDSFTPDLNFQLVPA